MRLPGFDMIFGLAAPAIDVFVEHASVAFVQIGDDEARVRSFRARFDAGDDPLDPAPALRAVEELLETTKLAVSGRGFETRLYAGFETFDMPAQRRSRRDAEDVIEAARPTPVENLGAAIMAVGAQQDLGVGPMGSDRAQQPAEEGFDLLAARPTRLSRRAIWRSGISRASSRIGAFFAGIVNSIDAELSAEGYTMIVGSLDGIEDKARRLVDLVYARQIDGVIILTGHIPLIDGRSLRDAGVPIVSVCSSDLAPDLPTVLVNDEECAVAQTRHLIDLGHRHLLYVSGSEGHYNEIVRYRGFLKAATASRAETFRYVGAYTLESGAAAARHFLGLDRRPTGVVCCSDEIAIGFIKTVSGAGVDVPDEVSIVGFDGIEFADYCEPTLTTIRQPCRDLGAAGARALLDSLRGHARAGENPIVLRGELLVRDSTGPAPNSRKRRSHAEIGGRLKASPRTARIKRAAT